MLLKVALGMGIIGLMVHRAREQKVGLLATAAVALFRRHRELLEYPPLGDFGQGTARTVLLRRAFLAVRAPILPLRLVDRLLARHPPRRIYRFLQFYCFWRSVRGALGDRDEWRRLTRGTTTGLLAHVGRITGSDDAIARLGGLLQTPTPVSTDDF